MADPAPAQSTSNRPAIDRPIWPQSTTRSTACGRVLRDSTRRAILFGVTATIAEHKRVLRRRMRMMRDLIEDRELRSIALWAAVASLPEYSRARVVMAFDGTKGEPDTDSLFARLASDGKTLVLPTMEDGVIVPRLVGDGLVLGLHGIREPQGDVVPVEEIDLVIVPGLAFTVEGVRLGRGGGHFDRFLPRLRQGCATVGACFVEQLVDELPCEAHDVILMHVVVDSPPDDAPQDVVPR